MIVAAGVLGPSWPSSVRTWLAVAAGLVALVGLFCSSAGPPASDGSSRPSPSRSSRATSSAAASTGSSVIRSTAACSCSTLAWSLVSSPLALVPWAVACVFLDAKRRREEAWLVEKHPDYEEYRRSVRASFVPFVW